MRSQSVTVGSVEGFSTGFDATGSWQAVTVPVGLHCKVVRISCREDDSVVYNHVDNPIEFHYSFNSDGTYFDWCTGMSIRISKDAGETILYVRGQVGYKFSITGLK